MDDDSRPIKAAKLSRGAKKRLQAKKLKEESKAQMKEHKVKARGKDKKKVRNPGLNIRRYRMFYADAAIEKTTNKTIMISNQLR